jgi:predicted alpha-1,2-mannosidase
MRHSMYLLCGVLAMSSAWAADPAPADLVNMYIGTAGGGSDYGGTMPLVTTPFGMTNWTAQTRQNKISVTSYAWEDHTISGFIGTHQPAIWMGDYGYVTLMPELDGVKVSPESRKLPFARKNEIAKPYYYSVVLDAGATRTIRTEMTATDHCAMLRFTFPRQAKSNVVVEATRPGIAGLASIDAAAHEITGYNPDRMDAHLGPLALPHFKGYFVIRFREPFAAFGTYHGAATAPAGTRVNDTNAGAWATFANGGVVEAMVGTSFISIEQARENLKAEIRSWDFDALRDALRGQWNRKLGIASVEGGSDDQRAIFYTGLYHAMLYPRLFSEHGKYDSAFDDSVHDGVSYTAYSLWDTFRAENSLITLFAPERVDAMVTALLQNYREGGWMPKWPDPSYTNIMIGTHADSVVAEAIAKGFHGFDRALAYDAVYKDATVPPDGDAHRKWLDREPHTPYEARGGLMYLNQLGYIPVDRTAEAASRTLEDAYDDWCAAKVAQAAGKQSEYAFLLKRSLDYRNLFNRATGLMQGKNHDGTWADPKAGWTEGDQWAYTWSVLHDIPGLIDLMGGAEAFNRKLDEHFSGGHNHHDNEPCHHYGYLFDYSGQPWKTQARVREIARQAYGNRPDGLEGNEDCGQMSAWYIFTAMGFYPVNPASAEYLIGSPIFTSTTLTLPNGKRFVIAAPNSSAENIYIQSARLNGKALGRPVIRYADIAAGGTLEFLMGPAPSKWAADWKRQPLDREIGRK